MATASVEQGFLAQSLEAFGSTATADDPAFLPHSSYMFDETNDGGLRDMQENIALQMNLAINGTSSSTNAMDTDQGQYGDTLSFDQDMSSPASASWLSSRGNGPSLHLQRNIVDGRRNLVNQHHGQITPPDDTAAEKVAEAKKLKASAAAAVEASNAKSERARNAANTRHARKNQARRASLVSNGDSPEGDDEGEGSNKRERYREKNRLAAAKCRAKKKTNTEDLESQARTIQGRNRQLKEEELHLRDELSFLRNCALEHVAGGCQNSRLLSYNQMKAEEAARTAQIGHSMQSSSMGSAGFANTTAEVASPGTQGGSSGTSSSDHYSLPDHDRRPSLHQLHSRAFGTGGGQPQHHGLHNTGGTGLDNVHHSHHQQSASPLSDFDHSMYDFARPTTQQSLAEFYASTASGDDFNFESGRVQTKCLD